MNKQITEESFDIPRLFAPVTAAIESHMAELLLSTDLAESFRVMFSAAYDTTATAFMILFPPANERRFRRDLRYEIPLEALSRMEAALEREDLISVNFLPSFKMAIRIVYRRIGGQLPMLPGSVEGLPLILSVVLFNQIVESACARRWEEPESPEANAAELAAARRERCQQFKDDMNAAGAEREVTNKAIARSAGVHESDMRKYLRGIHGPKSSLTQRIEDVLNGQTPLIFPPEKPHVLSRRVRAKVTCLKV
jgi:hypothetical protein